MKPTVGRIVLYRYAERSSENDRGTEDPVPAIITAVHSESHVNLRVFQDGHGEPSWKTSVSLRGVHMPGADSWEWPTLEVSVDADRARAGY